jgi:putative restriction endonuclease
VADRFFGAIAGVSVGATFKDRRSLAQAGVHRPLQAGISGAGEEGADSVVVSGGYEDDQDYGDEIIYTGHGGNDPASGKQVADQTLTRGNLALFRNHLKGLPVRVIRGAHPSSPHAPAEGFRYDGLYYVADASPTKGKSGYTIWRFTLVREPSSPTSLAVPSQAPTGNTTPGSKPVTTLRVVRNTDVATWVKEKHDYHCQVCGERLETPGGPYAEGAHIRPLGQPHNGPDTPDNVLCLCPNHHALFDFYAFTIATDMSLIGLPGTVKTVGEHEIGHQHLSHHRDRFDRAAKTQKN